jgi:CBS domain-containing protein
MKDITININTTIRDAMKFLNKTSEKCLLVVNKDQRFLGTLTNGD